MRRISLLILTILIAPVLVSAEGSKKGGVQIQGSLGSTSIALSNPDNTEADYTGFGLQGYGLLPLVDTNVFDAFLTGNLRYSDTSNTASTSSQSELLNLIGIGAGLQFTMGNFGIGADYNFEMARHYTVGPFSKQLNYNFTMLNYYAQMIYPLGALNFGLRYSYSSGIIDKMNTKLSKDTTYNETTIWLVITYSSGLNFWQLFGIK